MLSGALLLGAGEASAKCTVTLKFTNGNPNAITVLGNDSQSRVNGGWWSKMNFHNVTVNPGSTGVSTWTSNMSCGGNAKRDLKFMYTDSGDSGKYIEQLDNRDIDNAQLDNRDIDNAQTIVVSLEH